MTTVAESCFTNIEDCIDLLAAKLEVTKKSLMNWMSCWMTAALLAVLIASRYV